MHSSSVCKCCKGTGKTGNKKRATCFATLLQNELNSDVARFTIHIKPVLQQIRLLTGLNLGGKTRNIARQLVLQQVFAKQVARFLSPIFPYFNAQVLGWALKQTNLLSKSRIENNEKNNMSSFLYVIFNFNY